MVADLLTRTMFWPPLHPCSNLEAQLRTNEEELPRLFTVYDSSYHDDLRPRPGSGMGHDHDHDHDQAGWEKQEQDGFDVSTNLGPARILPSTERNLPTADDTHGVGNVERERQRDFDSAHTQHNC